MPQDPQMFFILGISYALGKTFNYFINGLAILAASSSFWRLR
jgi:hypothetical protein